MVFDMKKNTTYIMILRRFVSQILVIFFWKIWTLCVCGKKIINCFLCIIKFVVGGPSLHHAHHHYLFLNFIFFFQFEMIVNLKLKDNLSLHFFFHLVFRYLNSHVPSLNVIRSQKKKRKSGIISYKFFEVEWCWLDFILLFFLQFVLKEKKMK